MPSDIAPTVAATFGPDMSDDLEELASVALIAGNGAALILAGAFGGDRDHVDTKSSPTDMVSEIDEQAEAFVAATLAAHRPGDGLLGEEGTSRPGTTGIRWVVDPLDGTTNFLFGIPAYCVSIAAERKGETVVGLVIDPSRDETWAAVKGGGARLNGQRCRAAAGRSDLATALVGTGFGYRGQRRAWQAEVAAQVLPAVRDIRRSGSAALDLCWVAGGRLDAYYEWGLNPWDLAAGALICEEAGAAVEILPGRTIVAADPALRAPLVHLITAAGGLDPPDGPEPRLWEMGPTA